MGCTENKMPAGPCAGILSYRVREGAVTAVKGDKAFAILAVVLTEILTVAASLLGHRATSQVCVDGMQIHINTNDGGMWDFTQSLSIF